jgi:hypothetical protein
MMMMVVVMMMMVVVVMMMVVVVVVMMMMMIIIIIINVVGVTLSVTVSSPVNSLHSNSRPIKVWIPFLYF